MMNEKLKSKVWRGIEFVQTVLKARVGFGRSIPIDFKMLLSIQEEQRIHNLANNKATGIS